MRKNSFLILLSAIALTLLVLNLFRSITGTNQNVTLNSLLDFISNFNIMYELPSLEASIASFQIVNEWTILDGLRLFINMLGTLLGVASYLINNLIYCILFVGRFMIYILG